MFARILLYCVAALPVMLIAILADSGFSLAAAFNAVRNENLGELILVFVLSVAAVRILVFFYHYTIYAFRSMGKSAKPTGAVKKEIAESQAVINKAENDLNHFDWHHSKITSVVRDRKYLTLQAVSFMADLFNQGHVTSLQQAMVQYDDYERELFAERLANPPGWVKQAEDAGYKIVTRCLENEDDDFPSFIPQHIVDKAKKEFYGKVNIDDSYMRGDSYEISIPFKPSDNQRTPALSHRLPQ